VLEAAVAERRVVVTEDVSTFGLATPGTPTSTPATHTVILEPAA